MENGWFDEQDQLKITLGISFDDKLRSPDLDASLPTNNDGACPICYEELTTETEFALGCGHTFCKPCWAEHLATNVKASY